MHGQQNIKFITVHLNRKDSVSAPPTTFYFH